MSASVQDGQMFLLLPESMEYIATMCNVAQQRNSELRMPKQKYFIVLRTEGRNKIRKRTFKMKAQES
jgi:hypothetical protein